MSNTVIKVDNVSMRFKMPNEKIATLKQFFIMLISRRLKFNEFTALENVSFELKAGETLGLIGHNGAGKSTMLKIISGILKPTEGKICINGNIVPMLELGTGFDMELTGRENIYLNGAILGYDEEFLKEKFQEIVDFSDIGDFIDFPLRNYSSGMLMRLAFSVASVVKPEILIVDEILAVGDADFQEKSRNRMLEMMGGGTTVLFVSHNLEQIRNMCTKVLWLEHGKVIAYGDTKEICDKYEGNL